jgi:hypothetical protein
MALCFRGGNGDHEVVRANSGRYSSSVESGVSGWQALTIAIFAVTLRRRVGADHGTLAVQVQLCTLPFPTPGTLRPLHRK